MIITRRHITVALMIAMLLHGGIVMIGVSLPKPVQPPEPLQPLQINLLATIAESSKNTPGNSVEPPAATPEKTEPVVKKKSAKLPVSAKPKLIEKQPARLPAKLKPMPELKQAENLTESEPVTEQVTDTVSKTVQANPGSVNHDDVAMATYEQLLLAWLEKHKKYPRRAKRLRIEGEGMLRILISHAGKVLQVNLVQRTGNRLLDKAALEMAQRASPFPPMPKNDLRDKLEFIVPVAFMLR